MKKFYFKIAWVILSPFLEMGILIALYVLGYKDFIIIYLIVTYACQNFARKAKKLNKTDNIFKREHIEILKEINDDLKSFNERNMK